MTTAIIDYEYEHKAESASLVISFLDDQIDTLGLQERGCILTIEELIDAMAFGPESLRNSV